PNFCAAAGHPEWASDARFATNAARVKHRELLLPLLRQATVLRRTRDWIALLEPVGVPCGPVNDIAQVFDDPQVNARGLRIELPHPAAGCVPQVANPIRPSEPPVQYRAAPPLLGQHTPEVRQ